jgi:hypothetical protein
VRHPPDVNPAGEEAQAPRFEAEALQKAAEWLLVGRRQLANQDRRAAAQRRLKRAVETRVGDGGRRKRADETIFAAAARASIGSDPRRSGVDLPCGTRVFHGPGDSSRALSEGASGLGCPLIALDQ